MNTPRLAALVAVIIITFVEINYPQAGKIDRLFPLTIPFIDLYNLDTTYHTTWRTFSIPPKDYHKGSIDEFIYELVITIAVVGSETWNQPFALVYEIPGYTKDFIVVNEERYDLLPDRFNQFIVEIRTKRKGWAKFELAVFDETSGGVYIPINSYPLRRRDFLLE
jgi:hypothetical protein